MLSGCHRGIKHDTKVANNLHRLNYSNVNSEFNLGQESKIEGQPCYKELCLRIIQFQTKRQGRQCTLQITKNAEVE